MKTTVSRRRLMQAAGAAALMTPASRAATMPPPQFEGPDTPKIGLSLSDGSLGMPASGDPASRSEAAMRRIAQLGVQHVLTNGPRIPWDENRLREQMDALKRNGLSLGNLYMGFSLVVYNRPGRDEEIEKILQSIRVAGKLGIPVVEYNWYAHRASEGYFEETGRAGAGLTGFDYNREVEENGVKTPVKDLPPRPNEGAHTLDEMWSNITYFLKAVIPEAEKAGVRMALHPNDPPAPISRGSKQIMGTVEGWKKLIEIVNSPSNGITFDCGVTREMGHDPVEVCGYFASRDRINHMHFRNVRVKKPYERYTEVFIDEGENNMFAVMRELVKRKYKYMIYPEHPRALDYDRDRGPIRGYPGGGGYAAYAFNVGYARAMLQAALTV